MNGLGSSLQVMANPPYVDRGFRLSPIAASAIQPCAGGSSGFGIHADCENAALSLPDVGDAMRSSSSFCDQGVISDREHESAKTYLADG
jgi:hypothetical protein